jgi:acylphosphatase
MSYQAAHILVRGLVQGVGYRYFAFRTARQLGLVGWVKNLPDGSVEIEAEGDNSAIDEYIRELKVGPRSSVVRGVDVDRIEVSGKYSDFDVRY